MTIQEITQELIQKPLIGIEAQIKMAPLFRINDKYDAEPPHAVKSAVAIVLESKGEDTFFYLIKRTEDGHAHSGQISFPGGRFDDTDPDLQYTAKRELFEEIGITDVEFIKALTPLYVPISNFSIYPFVFKINESPIIKASKNEVSQVFKVNIKQLLNNKNLKKGNVQTRNVTLNVSYFELEKQVVWGATAMILSELKQLLKEQ